MSGSEIQEIAPTSPLNKVSNQIWIALLVSAVLGGAWLILAIPFMPLMIALLSIGLAFAFYAPFFISVAVLFFAYFKIDQLVSVLSSGRTVFMLSVLAFSAAILHIFVTRRIRFSLDRDLIIMLAFYILVTIGTSYDGTTAVEHDAWISYSKILIMTLAFTWFLNSDFEFETAVRAFVIGGVLISLVAIYNRYTGVGLVEMTRTTVGVEYLSNPNALAFTLLFPLSLAGAMMVVRSGTLNTLIGIATAPIILWAIVLTQSRGGLLGVAAVFTIIGSRFFRSKILLACIGVCVALTLYSLMGISERVSGGEEDIGQASAKMRIEAWQAALNMAITHPLTGVGLGDFNQEIMTYNRVFEKPFAAHSTWFIVLGETGFPGVVIFGLLVLSCVQTCFRNLRNLRILHSTGILPTVGLGLMAGVAAFCIHGSFASFAYQWPFYTLLAFTAALKRRLNAECLAISSAPSLDDDDVYLHARPMRQP